ARSAVLSGGSVVSDPATKRRSASSMFVRTRSGRSRPAAGAIERTDDGRTALPPVPGGKDLGRPVAAGDGGRAAATPPQSAGSRSATARETRCSRQRYG